jgi:hypothetical protein
MTMLALKMTRDINIATATDKELVAWYNENSGHTKPLDRFRDHAAAVKRTTELYNALKELASQAGSKGAEKQIKQEAKAAKRAAKSVPFLPPPLPGQSVTIPPEVKRRYESKTAPDSAYHNRERSTIQKPVDVVKGLCAANRKMARKDVIALCVAAGVNKNTAATQYSLWKALNP